MASRGGFKSLVVGLDGSAHSRHAAAFVGRLRAPSGGRVTVIRVVEPVAPPSLALLPGGVRARLAGEAARLMAGRIRTARREVEAAARRLRRSGWRARAAVRTGVPLPELLREARAARATLLVLGVRGVGGVKRMLLGSVTEGALRHAPMSVLVVR